MIQHWRGVRLDFAGMLLFSTMQVNFMSNQNKLLNHILFQLFVEKADFNKFEKTVGPIILTKLISSPTISLSRS